MKKKGNTDKNDLQILRDILVGGHITQYAQDQTQLATTLEEQKSQFEEKIDALKANHQAEIEQLNANFEERLRNLEAAMAAAQEENVQQLRTALQEQRDKLNKLGKRFAMLGALLAADEDEASASG